MEGHLTPGIVLLVYLGWRHMNTSIKAHKWRACGVYILLNQQNMIAAYYRWIISVNEWLITTAVGSIWNIGNHVAQSSYKFQHDIIKWFGLPPHTILKNCFYPQLKVMLQFSVRNNFEPDYRAILCQNVHICSLSGATCVDYATSC